MPVGQPVLGGFFQKLVRFALLVEVAGKTPFGTRKGYEVYRLVIVRINVPILLHRGIAGQAQAFADALALARVVNEQGEGARFHRQLGLLQ